MIVLEELEPKLLGSAWLGLPPRQPCALAACWAWCSVEWGRVGCGCAGNPVRSCPAQYVCVIGYCTVGF
jgi:hypothetical protein